MSKENLDEHIDYLVDRLSSFSEREKGAPVKGQTPIARGWSWETDKNGVYLKCSDEVEECLNLPPHAFIGQPLLAFKLAPRSTAELRDVFAEGMARRILVQFQNAAGAWCSVYMNINPRLDENGKLTGWYGFNQIVAQESEPFATSSESQKTAPAPVPVKASSEVPTSPPLDRETTGQESMELVDYLMVISRRKWVILTTLLFALLIVVIYILNTPTLYTAKTVVRVTNPRSGSAEFVEYNIELGERIKGTYVELANSNSVRQELSKYVNRTIPAAGSSGYPSIKATALVNTELFEISVEDPDPALAQFVANKVAEILIEQGKSILSDQALLVNVYIAEPASLPVKPSSPSPYLILVIGLVVGALGGLGLAFLFEGLDTRLYTDKQIELHTGFQVIGNIPEEDQPTPDQLFKRTIHAEAFRRLRTNIFAPAHNKNLKSLLVTSAVPKDGKSAIVANLAVSISQTGRSVLIIDANLRAPAIHKYFAVSNEMGLTNVLSNEIDFSSAVQATSYPKIWVITSGVAIQNPVEVLDSERMAEIISQAAKQYDVVLVDSPASISVTDPTVLTPMVDGVLLVVRHNWVRREALQATIRHLTAVNGNIIGIVSNRTDLGARTRLLRLR